MPTAAGGEPAWQAKSVSRPLGRASRKRPVCLEAMLALDSDETLQPVAEKALAWIVEAVEGGPTIETARR